MWTYPQHHICESCHQDMADYENEDDNVTCLVPMVEIDGVQYRRQKYHLVDADVDNDDEEERRCHDCNVKLGAIHHALCDMEMCPVCDDQFISCDCKDKAFLIL